MYRLTQGTHYRMENGSQVRMEVGSIFDPTPEELAAFGDRLTPVTGDIDPPVVDVDPNLQDGEPVDQGPTLAGYPGIGPKTAAALEAAGITTLESLKAVASGEDPNLPVLEEIKGISKSVAQKIHLILEEQEA